MASNFYGLAEKFTYIAVMVAKALPFVLFGAGAFAVFTNWRKKPRPFKRSASLSLLHGGEMALQRLVEYHEARADAIRLGLADCELSVELDKEQPDFRELTRIIARLEMGGHEDKAIRTLEEELKKAQKRGKSHEAYEIEMLLAEMLIYKGDYEKAKNCACLSDEKVSDARRPLFKAIISIALEPSKKEEAKAYWEAFIELRTHFGFQPVLRESIEETGIYKISTKFEEFEKVVKRLREDIKKAKDRKITIKK